MEYWRFLLVNLKYVLNKQSIYQCNEAPWRRHYNEKYRKISRIRRTLVGNKIVDHSDVVGASPVGAAPTTSSFST